MVLEKHQTDFIQHLVSSGALKFADKPENYFKLKSGRMSPYFCNMASAMDSGRKISETAKAYAAALDGVGYSFLHGPAMKGLPLVAAIADEIYRSKKRVVEFGYDFKDAESEILGDSAIGRKLTEEKKDVRILDKLQSTLVEERDYNGWSIQQHTEELLKTVLDNFNPANMDCVVGKAYAGVVPAALLVKRLWDEKKADVRFAYDRISTKEYGVTSEKFFVGDIRDGDRVLVIDAPATKLSGVFGRVESGSRIVLVDDVITTGKAKRESRDKVLKAQLKAGFACVLVGVHRSEVDEQGQNVEAALNDLGLSLKHIVTAPQIFEYARSQNLVGETAYANFQSYINQYRAKQR